MPKVQLEAIELMAEDGEYPNRSEALRAMAREQIPEEYLQRARRKIRDGEDPGPKNRSWAKR